MARGSKRPPRRRPIAVSFSALTGSALVFDRRVGARELRLAASGNLRRLDPLLWDREIESWWQQLTGEAVVGSLSGRRLGTVAAQTLSWSAFARRYPRGDVLVPPRRSAADYGRNPYLGYDRPSSAPHLFAGPLDRRLRPKERVVALPSPRPSVAVPFARLARDPALELDAGSIPVVVLFDPRVASAIDADSLAHSRQVGTAAAFERRVRGRPLTFDPRGNAR